jgi:hypothetical protein
MLSAAKHLASKLEAILQAEVALTKPDPSQAQDDINCNSLA